MEGNLPDKRAFARWYIEKSLFLKDKDMIFLSVSHKELDKVKEIFADFKFENGKSFMESSSFFDTEKENILMKFSTDVSKEEYRVEVTTEYIDKRNVNEVEDIIEDIDWHYENGSAIKEFEKSFDKSTTGIKAGDTIKYNGELYKAAWMVDDIMSSTGRIGLIPEEQGKPQQVVRFIGSYNLFDKIEKVQDKTVEVPRNISISLAKDIVDFMENYDRAFGYMDDIKGKSNKEEWIQTVKDAFLQGEGKAYVETVSRLKEETTRAMKQAIRIETELMKCNEGQEQVLVIEKTEEIFER